MSEFMHDMVKAMNGLHEQLKKAETFCLTFSHEILKDSKHFKKIDVHYEADSLVCVYKCNLDDRTYTVKVTPSKP